MRSGKRRNCVERTTNRYQLTETEKRRGEERRNDRLRSRKKTTEETTPASKMQGWWGEETKGSTNNYNPAQKQKR